MPGTIPQQALHNLAVSAAGTLGEVVVRHPILAVLKLPARQGAPSEIAYAMRHD